MEKVLYCRLAVLMAERDPGLSQAKVAEDTKLSTTTVNKLYKNKFNRVDKNTIETLCNYFDCNLQDLLTLKEVQQ